MSKDISFNQREEEGEGEIVFDMWEGAKGWGLIRVFCDDVTV